MFCRRCASSTTDCTVCKQPCRIIELQKNKMPEQLNDYFVPAADLLTKSIKVANFQLQKQDAFIAGKLGILEKYEGKKQKHVKLREHYEALKKAIEEEFVLIRKMRDQRRSPSILNASPSGSLFFQSQDSLRVATLKKYTPTDQQGMKRNRHVGSESGSSGIGTGSGGLRREMTNSQASYASGAKRITPGSRGSQSSTGSAKEPSISPIETFKKPNDLVATARPGIYQQTVRNIHNAMRRSTAAVVKVNNRGSDIDRARNAFF